MLLTGEGALTPDQEPPPDHGAELADPDVELIDRRNGGTGHDLGQSNQSGPPQFSPRFVPVSRSGTSVGLDQDSSCSPQVVE
jgi:hypothetical protein